MATRLGPRVAHVARGAELVRAYLAKRFRLANDARTYVHLAVKQLYPLIDARMRVRAPPPPPPYNTQRGDRQCNDKRKWHAGRWPYACGPPCDARSAELKLAEATMQRQTTDNTSMGAGCTYTVRVE